MSRTSPITHVFHDKINAMASQLPLGHCLEITASLAQKVWQKNSCREQQVMLSFVHRQIQRPQHPKGAVLD